MYFVFVENSHFCFANRFVIAKSLLLRNECDY